MTIKSGRISKMQPISRRGENDHQKAAGFWCENKESRCTPKSGLELSDAEKILPYNMHRDTKK